MLIKICIKNLIPTFDKKASFSSIYREIPNISPGLIEVLGTFEGAYIRRGLYSGGFIFGGYFVLVSEYQDLKNHCFV